MPAVSLVKVALAGVLLAALLPPAPVPAGPPPGGLSLIVVFEEHGIVSMPLRAPEDYLGSERVGDETLFRTRLPDGSVQVFHAQYLVHKAFVGNDAQERDEIDAYAARRAARDA